MHSKKAVRGLGMRLRPTGVALYSVASSRLSPSPEVELYFRWSSPQLTRICKTAVIPDNQPGNSLVGTNVSYELVNHYMYKSSGLQSIGRNTHTLAHNTHAHTFNPYTYSHTHYTYSHTHYTYSHSLTCTHTTLTHMHTHSSSDQAYGNKNTDTNFLFTSAMMGKGTMQQ